MKAAVKSTSSYFATTPGTPFELPVSPEVGDWVLVFSTGQAGGSSFPQPPSGWRSFRANSGVGTGTMAFGVYAKTYVSAADLSWSTLGTNTNVTSFLVLTGAGAPVDQWSAGAFTQRSVNATTSTAVAVSVSGGPGLALSVASERTTATETDAQITVAGSNKLASFLGPSTAILVLATKRLDTSSDTGNVTFTFPNVHAQNAIAGTLIIPDLPDEVPHTGMSVKVATLEGLADYKLKVSDGTALVEPRAVRTVSGGYGSVGNMLAKTPFKVAHRGGSADFAEMSMFAYNQSTLLGYDALEVSLGRTSDGVLFGVHDETLLRTSGVDLRPDSLTWEQAQQYKIFGSQPYMRFEDVLELYPDHVIFVDPKYIPYNLTNSLLDVMDKYGGAGRFVYKYYGASNNHATPKARGYKTWGYFYEVNLPTLDTWQGGWDILGMEYTASQEAWSAVTSYGKPVIGHICPTKAAVDTALSKGAVGVMVAGVRSAA